jgi:hypothetical protein
VNHHAGLLLILFFHKAAHYLDKFPPGTIRNAPGDRSAKRWEKVQKQKAGLKAQIGLFNLIPATTYVPTQLPVQYHRPGEA